MHSDPEESQDQRSVKEQGREGVCAIQHGCKPVSGQKEEQWGKGQERLGRQIAR
jgi:hypothetical protein